MLWRSKKWEVSVSLGQGSTCPTGLGEHSTKERKLQGVVTEVRERQRPAAAGVQETGLIPGEALQRGWPLKP